MDSVELDFDLEEEGTTVRARIKIVRPEPPTPLWCSRARSSRRSRWRSTACGAMVTVSGDDLVLPDVPDTFTLETAVRIREQHEPHGALQVEQELLRSARRRASGGSPGSLIAPM